MTRRTWWLLALAIAGLAVAASANSLPNGFVYDDIDLIQRHPRRMSDLAGWWREFFTTYWSTGDGYRPLTILAFKLQWVLGGGEALAFHIVNVVLHVLGSVAVFWLACAVLPLGAAWIASALYAVHPVHVEAIANVVGQSELVVGLLVTIAVGLYLHGRRSGPVSAARWAGIGVLYAVAMFFKEHAITLIALIPLAELTVVTDRASWRERLTRLRPGMLVLLALALGYLWVRGRVVQGTGFQAYIVFQGVELSTGNRILTMIGAAPEWLRLLLWPARLMTEYTPRYIVLADGPSLHQLPGLLVLLGTLGLCAATWRRSPVTAFGIGWLVVTLLPSSNFIVPAGFIIAERTLFLPSVGAMLAVGSAVPWLYAQIEQRRRTQSLAVGALALLVGLGIARSATRNNDWTDNETLMRQGVKDTPESYRVHVMLGNVLIGKGNMTEAEQHYQEAMRLFPYDPVMILALAEQYRVYGFCKPSLRMYQWLYTLKPNIRYGHLEQAQCLLAENRPEEARAAALRAIDLGVSPARARVVIRAAEALRDSLDGRGP